MSIQNSHQHYLQRTLELAQEAAMRGDHPFGSLLVKDGKTIACSLNTVITESDVTRHAELNLISWASKNIDPADLKLSTLYSSTETCAMCTGAIVWSGVKNIVYACSAKGLAEIAGGGFSSCRSVFHYYCETGTIEGPLLENEGLKIHEDYW